MPENIFYGVNIKKQINNTSDIQSIQILWEMFNCSNCDCSKTGILSKSSSKVSCFQKISKFFFTVDKKQDILDFFELLQFEQFTPPQFYWSITLFLTSKHLLLFCCEENKLNFFFLIFLDELKMA
jgi:hypothetical protein